ncbi:L-2-amino-thiazoline-4-carboxylic acid hydrolase [Oculatella sp. LEGE 06141]|uniref:L-2-amino-thiazoline-4-carboxylic acid hydrolase n=1 Tax=Oculatella sp. LEGE 06141 TaxID=1828648 RepID=UPI001D1526C9|nr:L-2-amino-thiazoline-4-carboxylic acid hydrolase [Oculatella sp. LEGE 06141]
MQDILNLSQSKAMTMFGNRFTKYKELTEEMGEDAAFEKLMENYPEQQKALMGAVIDDTTLAKGFEKTIPMLGLMGFITEIVDVSQNGTDAALEIQRVCPALSLAKEYGIETPCRILCEMEQEAARRAYPEMKASILSKQAEGDCICVFKYERPAQVETASTLKSPNLLAQIGDLVRLIPTLIRIGTKMLKVHASN